MPDESTKFRSASAAADAPLRGFLRPWIRGRPPADPRVEARVCEHAGCTNRTADLKPFCTDHVELTPYVQSVLARLEAIEAEVAAADAGAAVLDGIVARDVVNQVAVRGRMVVSRLAAELGVPVASLVAVVEALAVRGRVVRQVIYARDGKELMTVRGVDPIAHPGAGSS